MPPFMPRFRTSTIALIILVGLLVLGFGVSKYFHNTAPPVLGGPGVPCTWAMADHPTALQDTCEEAIWCSDVKGDTRMAYSYTAKDGRPSKACCAKGWDLNSDAQGFPTSCSKPK